jgi:3-isopropylmalate dehydratase small subunit
MHFEIDEFRKKLLLEGLDNISLTLQLESHIARYERQSRTFAFASAL